MPTKFGAGKTRRSRAAPQGRPGEQGGWDPGQHSWLCLSPKGLLGLQKSNVCLAATLQHVFESIKNIRYYKTSTAPCGWSLLGSTSGRCWGISWLVGGWGPGLG